jgi:predicted thioesterase
VSAIQTGLKNETSHTVTEEHLATKWGSGLAPVLATPALVAFCEECARLSVDNLLPDGQQTVGSRIDLQHLAPTLPGMTVRIQAELTQIDGRRLCFQIRAWDELDQICAAEHERFIVDSDRFGDRLARKQHRE